ncbi:MAG: PqqD family peptide modification chaperone [Marinifilaceae bacterium]|nr:PqqD family peptide modification chaperone [Marinifilaceae bacterium]
MRIREGYSLSLVGNDYFVLEEGMDVSDNIYPLSDIAARVWEYVMERDFRVSSVAKFLTNECDYDILTAQVNADEMVKEWLEAGFIEE